MRAPCLPEHGGRGGMALLSRPRQARGAAWLVLCLTLAGGASAQAIPVEAPQPDRSVRDPEFGVIARYYGLERQVRMYQWQATGTGYAKAWSSGPVDSAGFAPGHANPPFPLRSRRWIARSISIGGKPLDAAVIAGLGQWRDARPSFSALPGNLAATFQPEGDGLGSAENPLDPQVGDLRIRWRELVLPPLQGRIVLRDGRWRLLTQRPLPAAQAPRAPVPTPAAAAPRRIPWLFATAAIMALIAAIAAIAARRRRSSK